MAKKLRFRRVYTRSLALILLCLLFDMHIKKKIQTKCEYAHCMHFLCYIATTSRTIMFMCCRRLMHIFRCTPEQREKAREKKEDKLRQITTLVK